MTYVNRSPHTLGNNTCNCSTVIKLTFIITITNVGGNGDSPMIALETQSLMDVLGLS